MVGELAMENKFFKKALQNSLKLSGKKGRSLLTILTSASKGGAN
jgi:geranylgeranyl pyrophosphate synthase